ncbi:hypothetical protein HRI_002052100 [Hibiscus trionum]|uniref:Uncharacterized protein n=1 Tax=Hibiscus trionum TaxID=183268 RepID=A0A9W7HW82_HIBTR|nr:hypothetical protein HRI_002052100 [Hibiscus trionum]
MDENPKRPLRDINGRVSSGAIKKTISKTSTRSGGSANGLARKNGKLKKGDIANSKDVDLTRWVNNMDKELSLMGDSSSGAVPLGTEKQSYHESGIHWVENSAFEGDPRRSDQ